VRQQQLQLVELERLVVFAGGCHVIGVQLVVDRWSPHQADDHGAD
jgi:hypothetical protein